MHRLVVAWTLLVAAAAASPAGPPDAGPAGKKKDGPFIGVSAAERLDAIRRAQVWRPVDIRSLDLARGPGGPGSFAPFQSVPCDFEGSKKSGTTSKFSCLVAPGDAVKVKYGVDEGELYAEPVATRLFWALGFGTDASYRVRVECRDCPADPWESARPLLPLVAFDPATIERPLGDEIAMEEGQGWAFADLHRVSEAAGGAPPAHRDALRLLAVFVQHSDNKPANQRLVCLPGGEAERPDGRVGCTMPFMYVSDLGSTFGRGNLWRQRTTARANFEEWSRVPVWRDDESCRTRLGAGWRSPTLQDPHVSEAGRRFLADLLVQLSDRQIRDMFEAGTIDRRGWPSPEGHRHNGTIDQWVEAFKRRRQSIVERRCPG